MQRMADAFLLLEDNVWLCRAPIALEGPTGTVNVTPGVVYRKGKLLQGLDIADVLERWRATGRLPPGITIKE